MTKNPKWWAAVTLAQKDNGSSVVGTASLGFFWVTSEKEAIGMAFEEGCKKFPEATLKIMAHPCPVSERVAS